MIIWSIILITKKSTTKKIVSKTPRKISNATLFKRTRKLSVLLKIALEDLIKCEKDKKYKINMSVWYIDNSHCSVCMAGSVLAQSLRKDTNKVIKSLCNKDQIDLMPQDYYIINDDNDIESKLTAIDSLRQGDIDEAILRLGLDYPKTEIDLYTDVIDYRTSPSLFKRDIRRLIKYLEKHGY